MDEAEHGVTGFVHGKGSLVEMAQGRGALQVVETSGSGCRALG